MTRRAFRDTLSRMAEPQPPKLNSRHQQILRLVFEGMKNTQIADIMGMRANAIGLIKKSPIFQAELARLQLKAEESMTNMPVRMSLMHEVNGFGIEALRLNRSLMADERVSVKLRSRIATHAMDRIVFGRHSDDEGTTNYRDILGKLNEVSAQLKRSLVTPTETLEVSPERSEPGGSPEARTRQGFRVVSDKEDT